MCTVKITEQMRASLEKARAVAAKAEAENRDMSSEEVAEAAGHLKTYEALKAAAKESEGADAVKSALEAIEKAGGFERNPEGGGGMGRQMPGAFEKPERLKTIGQMFVESAEYKGLMSQFPSGHIGRDARIQSGTMGVKALITGASDTLAGAFVTTDRQPDFELLGRRRRTIRDLVSVRTTDSDTVDFVRQTTQMTSAAPVAEATTSAAPTTGASSGAPLTLAAGGGYKPEGTMALEVVTATVKTIAEWIPATKRALADASQLRGLIDQELRDDLAEEEEDQMLNGSGSGENLTGILNTSGIQTQAYSATVADLDPLIETTLKARTKVLTTGRAIPTAYLLNPLDFEKIQLARLAKNPQNEATAGSVPTLHGLPVVESEAIAAGRGLVGDFRKAVIWDREQAGITATDSHADFFVRNLVAILAEERLAFGVLRPKAFVDIDLTA